MKRQVLTALWRLSLSIDLCTGSKLDVRGTRFTHTTGTTLRLVLASLTEL